ncbi:hypothetical protein lerEdw1_014291 [Lerista edwardsae]|nr:hypothetical protein lerEdw1_014292 [Lerista edwardsae]KAJ6633802.1 hypothetical protein lerEdw1_014291 [Lerista edwardsae]
MYVSIGLNVASVAVALAGILLYAVQMVTGGNGADFDGDQALLKVLTMVFSALLILFSGLEIFFAINSAIIEVLHEEPVRIGYFAQSLNRQRGKAQGDDTEETFPLCMPVRTDRSQIIRVRSSS